MTIKVKEMIGIRKRPIILRESTAIDLNLMHHLLINHLSIDQDLEALGTKIEM